MVIMMNGDHDDGERFFDDGAHEYYCNDVGVEPDC